jgi:phosphoribosylglycinamide formyltransferase-1
VIKKNVAVLISGSGSNLQALMDAAADENYPAKIALVISNKADAFGVTRAQNANITTIIISHKDYESREEFDAAMQEQLLAHNIDIVCLAGFMRLLSGWFVNLWAGKMLNIHPSLLPNFKGGNAVQDALDAGATETGCSVHLVTEEMDEGPVLGQIAVPVLADDTKEKLHQRIHTAEHMLYPQALKQLAQSL